MNFFIKFFTSYTERFLTPFLGDFSISLAKASKTEFLSTKALLRPLSAPQNPLYCINLENYIYGNSILAEELYVKALWIFETESLSTTSYRELVQSIVLPVIFDDSHRVTYLLNHFILTLF